MEKLTYIAKEVATVMGVSLSTVRALCCQPDFPAIRVSPRRIVVPVDGLKAWMERNAGKAV